MSRQQSPIGRLLQIRQVIRKYSLVNMFDDMALSGRARLAIRLGFGSARATEVPIGERIRQALEELGPVFVKLGQALSTRPDLLPVDVAHELAKLQDQVPAFSGDTALEIIHAAYGQDFEQIFASVERKPLASASVAQVHAAKLKPGLAVAGQNGTTTDDVIVKVLRPGIREVIESDLRVMRTFAGLLQKHWARGQQFRPLDVIEEYSHTIHDEIDLRTEAANGGRMGANFEDTDIIYVPRIYWDYTHTNILVMERIFGTPIREFQTLKDKGYDLKQLASDGVEVFFKQAFEDNFFHADMHGGNIFVSDQGRWMAIDFGIMGTLDEQDKQYLGQMLLGFFNRDYHLIAQAHLRAGWVPAGTRAEEFEQAIRVVCEPIFAKPISEISFGNVLVQLFQTVRRFEMPVQPQLVLLYKTLLNIEGLGRQLYPDLNLWDTAKPFLENWMKKQMSPQAIIDDIKRDWPQIRALLPEVPNLLKQAIENRQQPAPPQASQDPKPSRLGLGIAGVGLALTLLAQNDVLLDERLVGIGAWIGVLGLLLVVFRSR